MTRAKPTRAKPSTAAPEPAPPATVDTAATDAPAPVAAVADAKPSTAAPEPYPTQADLDAMKSGTFGRNREMKAETGSATYKTR